MQNWRAFSEQLGVTQDIPNDAMEKAMSKDISVRRGGGGAATTAGTTFQEDTGAYLATLILAENLAPSILDLPADVTLEAIASETWNALDDIELHTSAGGRVFIQCKTSISLSSDPESTFGKVIRELIAKVLPLTARDAKDPIEFVTSAVLPTVPLDPILNRCALIVGRNAPASISVHLQRALDVIRAQRRKTTPRHISHVRTSRPRRPTKSSEARSTTQSMSERADRWESGSTRPPTRCKYSRSSTSNASTLRRMVLIEPWPTTSWRGAIVREPTDAARAWNALIGVVRRFGPFRTGGGREFLRNALLKAGLRLRGPTDPTDAEFESTYRLQIAKQLDKIRLYGIEDIISNPDESSREYPLQRAFVASLVSPDEELSAAPSPPGRPSPTLGTKRRRSVSCSSERQAPARRRS